MRKKKYDVKIPIYIRTVDEAIKWLIEHGNIEVVQGRLRIKENEVDEEET